MLFLGLIAWAILALWAAYSLLCIVIPIKPFKARGSAAKSLAGTLVAWVGVTIFVAKADFPPVPSTQLAAPETTQEDRSQEATEERRVFVEDEFYWDDDTSKFKPQIVAVVNRISRENVNCPDPDPQSVARSDRGSPDAPMFFVTCGSGMDIFNVWFSPDDADSENPLSAVLPPSRTSAISACEQTAVNAASHPSTVKFSGVMSLSFQTWKSGNAEVRSTFTAKNAFNLETKYNIVCSFTGSKMTNVSIAEARN